MAGFGEEPEFGDERPPVEEDEDYEPKSRKLLKTRVVLWEFGQNDAKRDSGSKAVRMGLVSSLKVGKPFNGVVLSSEASEVLSPADLQLVVNNGLGAINCSWNRLDEIPFAALGKHRNHRKLPFIVAANSVNYGKPFKMNTVEALAAALVVVGLREDAEALLEPQVMQRPCALPTWCTTAPLQLPLRPRVSAPEPPRLRGILPRDRRRGRPRGRGSHRQGQQGREESARRALKGDGRRWRLPRRHGPPAERRRRRERR